VPFEGLINDHSRLWKRSIGLDYQVSVPMICKPLERDWGGIVESSAGAAKSSDG